MELIPDLQYIDHLIYYSQNLEEGIQYIAEVSGVMPAYGGKHKGKGTRNAIIALGSLSYLEILAPDPEQTPKGGTNWLGIDTGAPPGLKRWVAKSDRIKALTRHLKRLNVDLGETIDGSRKTPNGSLLSWQLSDPSQNAGEGSIPFLIDWGSSPHPAESAPPGCQLLKFTLTHPKPQFIKKVLSIIGVNIEVQKSEVVKLYALIDTPKGVITID